MQTTSNLKQLMPYQSQEMYSVMKELLPQIEEHVRKELSAGFQQELKSLQKHYQLEVGRLINEKENLIKQQYAEQLNKIKNQLLKERQDKQKEISRTMSKQLNRGKDGDTTKLKIQLEQCKKRVAMLEKQRTNWLLLQKKYKNMIKELSNKKNEEFESISINNMTAINSVHPTPCEAYQLKQQDQDDDIDILLYEPTKRIEKQLYASVLSPPPPPQNFNNNNNLKDDSITQQRKSLFWDENRKKQLLSMIRNKN